MSKPSRPLRHKPSVYRRRRLAVLIGFVALVAIIVMLVLGPERVSGWFGGESASPATSPTADSETSPPPVEPETPPEITECVPGAVAVEPVSDSVEYAIDRAPQFSLRVTNHGAVACDIDLGNATMVFTVRSGQERYWDSRDCQVNPENFIVRMEPRQTLESDAFEWDRKRSSPDTCDEELDAVPAGGASYHLEAEVGGVASSQSRQFILY